MSDIFSTQNRRKNDQNIEKYGIESKKKRFKERMEGICTCIPKQISEF